MVRCFSLVLVSGVVAWLVLTPAGNAGDGKGMVGTWISATPGQKFKEVWMLKQDKGMWSVTCVYKQGDKDVGSFHGEEVKFANGALQFKQVFDVKPVPSWPGGSIVSVQLKEGGDKLEFTWQNGGLSGKGVLDRARDTGTEKK